MIIPEDMRGGIGHTWSLPRNLTSSFESTLLMLYLFPIQTTFPHLLKFKVSAWHNSAWDPDKWDCLFPQATIQVCLGDPNYILI